MTTNSGSWFDVICPKCHAGHEALTYTDEPGCPTSCTRCGCYVGTWEFELSRMAWRFKPYARYDESITA